MNTLPSIEKSSLGLPSKPLAVPRSHSVHTAVPACAAGSIGGPAAGVPSVALATARGAGRLGAPRTRFATRPPPPTSAGIAPARETFPLPLLAASPRVRGRTPVGPSRGRNPSSPRERGSLGPQPRGLNSSPQPATPGRGTRPKGVASAGLSHAGGPPLPGSDPGQALAFSRREGDYRGSARKAGCPPARRWASQSRPPRGCEGARPAVSERAGRVNAASTCSMLRRAPTRTARRRRQGLFPRLVHPKRQQPPRRVLERRHRVPIPHRERRECRHSCRAYLVPRLRRPLRPRLVPTAAHRSTRSNARASARTPACTGRQKSSPSVGTGSTVMATTARAPAGPNPYRPRAKGMSAAGGLDVIVTARSSVAGSVNATPASDPGAIVTITCSPFTVLGRRPFPRPNRSGGSHFHCERQRRRQRVRRRGVDRRRYAGERSARRGRRGRRRVCQPRR